MKVVSEKYSAIQEESYSQIWHLKRLGTSLFDLLESSPKQWTVAFFPRAVLGQSNPDADVALQCVIGSGVDSGVGSGVVSRIGSGVVSSTVPGTGGYLKADGSD